MLLAGITLRTIDVTSCFRFSFVVNHIFSTGARRWPLENPNDTERAEGGLTILGMLSVALQETADTLRYRGNETRLTDSWFMKCSEGETQPERVPGILSFIYV